MFLAQRSLDDHVKAVLSDENRYFTKQNLRLDREPTVDELLANYKRYVIIASVYGFDAQDETDEHQLPLFI